MPSGSQLRGRRRECGLLDDLLTEVRAGRSRALVLRGEAGCGKTALLDYVAGRALPDRVLRASGVESESDIAFSGVQQLCGPLTGDIGRLPEPQGEALATALGLHAGSAPEPLLVGLAVLGLLAEAAAGSPLVCIVDDVQWIDAMSAVILSFVARRLDAESVALVFAARSPGDERLLTGIADLQIGGLPAADARALLDSVLTGPVDRRVRDRIVAETKGNPLALIELPRGFSQAEMAFGFSGHHAMPLASRVEDAYQRRIAALPAGTRTLLLTAAVEPVGDTSLLWRALDRLDVEPDAAGAAEAEDLIELGTRVRFKHPLARSAAWRAGQAAELRAVHAALAEVTDPELDPDRRAWHRAHAAAGPDAEVALELEQSAGRALARGGQSSAAAFQERAAELTLDPAHRTDLLVAAAASRFRAGSFAAIADLLAAAELSGPDAAQQAWIERMRAQTAFILDPGPAAMEPMIEGARRIVPLDTVQARMSFGAAIGVPIQVGRFSGDGLRTAARVARDISPPGTSLAALLVSGLASWALDDRATAVRLLETAMDAPMPPAELYQIWLIQPAALELFRLDLAHRVTEEAVRFNRSVGGLSVLPTALSLHALGLLYAGRFADAASLLDEVAAITQSTGSSVDQSAPLALAAYRGREQQALELIEATKSGAAARGFGRAYAMAVHAKAVLCNGLGDHRAALEAARDAAAYHDLGLLHFALRELIEAAAGSGERQAAAEARDRLAELTGPLHTRWARGAQALADALVAPHEQAEEHYRAAIEHLSTSETTIEVNRARLLFGQWLREADRPAEARDELRAAFEAFTTMGAAAFAGRAEKELAATGEAVRKRPAGTPREELTPQEGAIARMAAAGRTNPEIAGALFLSPRTVEWHLRKVFTKFGITSRRELPPVLT